jgi:hypothetical protein
MFHCCPCFLDFCWAFAGLETQSIPQSHLQVFSGVHCLKNSKCLIWSHTIFVLSVLLVHPAISCCPWSCPHSPIVSVLLASTGQTSAPASIILSGFKPSVEALQRCQHELMAFSSLLFHLGAVYFLLHHNSVRLSELFLGIFLL